MGERILRMSSRRGWFLLLWLAVAWIASARAQTIDADSVVRYVLSCRKSDGAFGPAAQRYSGLAWTYPAVMTLQLLGHPLDDPNACLSAPQEYRAARPWQALFEQTLLGKALDSPPPFPSGPAAQPISFVFLPPNDPRNPAVFRQTPTEITYSDLESLQYALSALLAGDRRIQDPTGLINFVRSGQHPNGDFYSHIAATAHAIRIHAILKVSLPLERQCILWLRSCQTPEGGFRFSPTDPSQANRADIRYTFLALSALTDLKARPTHPQACIDWINSLQNSDGGFSDQPGLPSRLASTYWAVQSLQLLTGNIRQAIRSKSVLPPKPQLLPADLSLFQACLTVPMPAPDDLDRLRKSGVNLVGIPGPNNRQQHAQITRLNAAARSRSLPLECVACIECTARKLRLPDQTVADHSWFCLIDPIVTEADWTRTASLQTAASVSLSSNDFLSNVLSTVRQIPAFIYPENDLSPMMAYRLFDESVIGPVAYSALVAFDAAGRDAVRLNPDLERWLGRLPMIPNNAGHGNLDEWFNDPAQSRVLFWAKGCRLADFLAAVNDDLAVCVIRRADSLDGVVYYGRPDLVDTLKLRMNDWQWWKPGPDPAQTSPGESHG